ncbi:MAG: hypothetical protein M3Q19_14490 [Pseudomonadota bacterium]|nr:hypothetical protein [Pseudomonadota bacterium]
MERIADDLVIQLMLSEPTVARITEAVVGEALEGFELEPVAPTWWIARAVQGALYCTLKNVEEGPERQSNAETRDDLADLAKRAGDLWKDIAERSPAVDDALWWAAVRRWEGEESDFASANSEYSSLVSNLAYLDRLASFLTKAANDMEPQRGPWRNAERHRLRVERAHYLSPVFELAYDRKARVDDWPMSKSLGPWPDFYQRIVSVAFGERVTPNLREVVKEGSRRHKNDKVEFAPGIIPDWPL